MTSASLNVGVAFGDKDALSILGDGAQDAGNVIDTFKTVLEASCQGPSVPFQYFDFKPVVLGMVKVFHGVLKLPHGELVKSQSKVDRNDFDVAMQMRPSHTECFGTMLRPVSSYAHASRVQDFGHDSCMGIVICKSSSLLVLYVCLVFDLHCLCMCGIV